MPRAAGPLRRHLSRAAQPAPVAQLDRAPDYESGGQEFESLRARQNFNEYRQNLSARKSAMQNREICMASAWQCSNSLQFGENLLH